MQKDQRAQWPTTSKLEILNKNSLDLILAIDCMHEMDKSTIQYYFKLFNHISKNFYLSIWSKTDVPYSKNILKLTNKPVSLEVFADDTKNMINQGRKISRWGRNVYVKVPVRNSKGNFTGKVINKLSKNKV